MKASVLYGIGDLRFEEVPLPKIEKREVLVRIKAVSYTHLTLPTILLV